MSRLSDQRANSMTSYVILKGRGDEGLGESVRDGDRNRLRVCMKRKEKQEKMSGKIEMRKRNCGKKGDRIVSAVMVCRHWSHSGRSPERWGHMPILEDKEKRLVRKGQREAVK